MGSIFSEFSYIFKLTRHICNDPIYANWPYTYIANFVLSNIAIAMFQNLTLLECCIAHIVRPGLPYFN